MAGPATVANAAALLAGAPANVLWANLGTAFPTNTVVGGVFTDVWASATGWTPLGYTDAGATFSAQTSTTDISVAESLDPIIKLPNARTSQISAALVQITKSSLTRAMNGGAVVVTGSTGTTFTTIEPPDLGGETRCMIGIESVDGTVRIILRQAYNSSNIQMQQNKGAKALINCQWDGEVPSGAKPFWIGLAGATRGA